MHIYCGKQPLPMPASKMVNKLGKYLYKHLDGAYQFKTSGNMYDVYFTLLYQLKPEFGGKVNDVKEMTVNINITTYQNKIRVNVIEITPEERTIGYDLFTPDKLQNLEEAKDLIFNRVVKRISKAYENYIFLF